MRVSVLSLSECAVAVALLAILLVAVAPRRHALDAAAKYAATRQQLRDLGQALDAYRVDYAQFPPGNNFGLIGNDPALSASLGRSLFTLTTPVAYASDVLAPSAWPSTTRLSAATALGLLISLPTFVSAESVNQAPGYEAHDNSELVRGSSSAPFPKPATNYLLAAVGPQEARFSLGGVMVNASGVGTAGSQFANCLDLIYDPTNGTTSFGNVFRVDGAADANLARQLILAIETVTFSTAVENWQGFE